MKMNVMNLRCQDGDFIHSQLSWRQKYTRRFQYEDKMESKRKQSSFVRKAPFVHNSDSERLQTKALEQLLPQLGFHWSYFEKLF